MQKCGCTDNSWLCWPKRNDVLIFSFTLLLQAKGGALAFLKANPSFTYENISDGKAPQTLLAYVNGDHEYVLFDPYGKEVHELSKIHWGDRLTHEEKGTSFCCTLFYT